MTPDDDPLKLTIDRVSDWLYCLRTAVVAVYAVQHSTGFILIDSGVVGYEHYYLEALGRVGSIPAADVRVTEILLTHGHDDHTGSAAALKCLTGAGVRGPARDAEVIEGKAHSPQPVLLDWEIPLFERFGHVEPAPRVELDELLEDGDLLGWERPAQVVAAPGHTAGSIAIFFSDDHVLIAGDAITTMSGEPAIGVFNADPEQARESVRRLTRLDASILCVGHGPPITVDAQARIARATYVGASPETRGIG